MHVKAQILTDQVEEVVWMYLRNGRRTTQADVAAATKQDKEQVRTIVNTLCRLNLMEKVEKGRYAVTNAGRRVLIGMDV